MLILRKQKGRSTRSTAQCDVACACLIVIIGLPRILSACPLVFLLILTKTEGGVCSVWYSSFREHRTALYVKSSFSIIMGPKKVSTASTPSKKKARNTIELKKEIVEMYESGIKIAEIGRMYGKSPSTISSIVAKREEIKEANVAKGVNMLTKQRSQTIEDVEQLLLIWINEKEFGGDFLSEAIMCEKARLLYANRIKERPGTNDIEFKASRGWFEKFKRRSGIHSVSRRRESASSNKLGTEECESKFKETEGFVPQQAFNRGNTGPFWNAITNRVIIRIESSGTASREEEKKDHIPLEPTILIKEEPLDYNPTPSTSTDTANEEFILPHEENTWTPPVPAPLETVVEPQFTLSVASLAVPNDPENPEGEQVKKKRKTNTSTFVPSTNGSEMKPQSPVYNFSESSNPGSSKDPRKDQFDVFGEYIAAKLRSLDRRSCAHAQKAIGDIIFEAEMGKFLDGDCDSKDLKNCAS